MTDTLKNFLQLNMPKARPRLHAQPRFESNDHCQPQCWHAGSNCASSKGPTRLSRQFCVCAAVILMLDIQSGHTECIVPAVV